MAGIRGEQVSNVPLLDGTRPLTGNMDAGGNRITNLAAPVNPNDAARLADIGATSLNVVTVNTTYAVLPTDEIILADATVAPFTITMPNAALFAGRSVTIKKVAPVSAANFILVITLGGNLDGTPTYTLNIQFDAATFTSDGLNWWIV